MAAPNTPRNFAGSVNFDGAKAKEERDYVEEAIEQYRQQLLNPQRQAQPPRGRGKGGGKGGGGGGKNRGFKNEPRALPKSRAVGLVQGKDEPDADFAVRKSQAVPKGARSGKSGGLDEQLFLQEGYTPEAARLKANILRSEGGEAFRAEDGSIQTRGAGQRKDVLSSTGRAYDPIRERKELMQRGREAVAARKEAQGADRLLEQKAEASARTPGTMRGFANKYGTGSAKTLTAEEFANRPPATVTLGRNKPFTLPLRDEIDILKREQSRK